ncbi:MAG: hypothetical protein V4787_25035 [Pseudomonadota bacterium]
MHRLTLLAAIFWIALPLHAAGPDQERVPRAPTDPVRVGPTLISREPESAVPAISPPSPPLAIPRPATISSCDPAGCWDSEGRRLNNQGPLLLGPRGPCLQQGGVVSCP